MKWIKIDDDSYGTILVSWCICAVLIFLTARYIPILWISLPLCVFFVVFGAITAVLMSRRWPEEDSRTRSASSGR